MDRFLSRYGDSVIAVLSGFDRLVFRGSLRRIAHTIGLATFLSQQKILLKDFKNYALDLTATIKNASIKQAEKQGRPVVYLESAARNKEAIAREIASREGIERGLIVVLSCIEPCLSFEIRRNRQAKQLELNHCLRKCLHLYHYFLDPVFGFMSARIQTWLPFNVQVCINGREWLALQMDQAGIHYRRKGNCFTWVEDADKAQSLLDHQLTLDWTMALNRIRRMLNPVHTNLFRNTSVDYYWTVYQSEWATDLMFRSTSSLAEIYPGLVQHAITTFSSPDVMRFLGRRVRCDFSGEVQSRFTNRSEGVRVKHSIGPNSVKLYDKEGSVLRVETTIHRAEELRCYRPKEGEPDGDLAWRPLRRGIADLHRRAKLSHASNQRYLDAIASCKGSTRLGQLVARVSRKTCWKNHPVRPLKLGCQDDLKLLTTISRGEFHLRGFRNKDLRFALFTEPTSDPTEIRRRSARVSQLLRILRAHGVIKKVPHSYRYRLTKQGQMLASAIITAQTLTLEQIHAAAA